MINNMCRRSLLYQVLQPNWLYLECVLLRTLHGLIRGLLVYHCSWILNQICKSF